MGGNEGECHLLQGFPGLTAQISLAVVAFSVLIIKRVREQPQRTAETWRLDVGKQVVGLGIAHICGILIALVAYNEISSSSSCSWYFVAYTFDTTLGVLLTVLLHRLVVHQAKALLRPSSMEKVESLPETMQNDGTKLLPRESNYKESVLDAIADCGNYGSPIKFKYWIVQTLEWSICVVIARALCGLSVFLLAPTLQGVAHGLDNAFTGHPTLLLFFVMVCCPLLMNGMQLLLQDSVLKANLRVASWSGGGELVRLQDPAEGRRDDL